MPKHGATRAPTAALSGGPGLLHLRTPLKMVVAFSVVLAAIAVMGAALFVHMETVKRAEAAGARALETLQAAEKGPAFEMTVAPEAAGWFMGDAVRIRQVMGNLFSNALKFTESGRVDGRIERQGDVLRLSVADTGCGIGAPDRARLFDRFVQADGSSTRKHGGAGLGLAICRDLAALMGGTVTVESTPDEGSVFALEIALPPSEPAAREDLATPPPDRPVRVLIAEDNPANRLVLSTLLSQFAIESEAVEDGEAAVEAWASGDWDAILMDIHMPRMDGMEATAGIRRREQAEKRPRTPIIAVTASTLAHETDGYLAAGMDGWVPKPVDARRMLETLKSALGV